MLGFKREAVAFAVLAFYSLVHLFSKPKNRDCSSSYSCSTYKRGFGESDFAKYNKPINSTRNCPSKDKAAQTCVVVAERLILVRNSIKRKFCRRMVDGEL